MGGGGEVIGAVLGFRTLSPGEGFQLLGGRAEGACLAGGLCVNEVVLQDFSDLAFLILNDFAHIDD